MAVPSDTGPLGRLLASGAAGTAENKGTPTEHLRNTYGTLTDILRTSPRVNGVALPWQDAPDKVTSRERADAESYRTPLSYSKPGVS